jgi:hypothetical protein
MMLQIQRQHTGATFTFYIIARSHETFPLTFFISFFFMRERERERERKVRENEEKSIHDVRKKFSCDHKNIEALNFSTIKKHSALWAMVFCWGMDWEGDSKGWIFGTFAEIFEYFSWFFYYADMTFHFKLSCMKSGIYPFIPAGELMSYPSRFVTRQ